MAPETSKPGQKAKPAQQIPRAPSPSKELSPMNPWRYDAVLWTMSVLADLFFREVHPRGAWRVPRHGPILFVAAPHANQVGNASLLEAFPS
jgi:glycerol-3-phosphate O-acyltransferase/dihydroxyacetone phosphate acyltransferase